MDLSKIDFDALRTSLKKSHKRADLEILRAAITAKLEAMSPRTGPGPTSTNSSSASLTSTTRAANVEAFYEELLKFAQNRNVEEQRHVREKMTEEELVIFDILTSRARTSRPMRKRGQEGRHGPARTLKALTRAGLAEAAAGAGGGAALHQGILGQAAAGVYAGPLPGSSARRCTSTTRPPAVPSARLPEV